MLEQEMTRLANKIDVSYDDLPKINEYNYIGTPFILQHISHYEYVIQEGNEELKRDNHFSVDNLLYEYSEILLVEKPVNTNWQIESNLKILASFYSQNK